jgi:FixJ family two-component response regulator
MSRAATVYVVDDDAQVRRAISSLVGSIGMPVEAYASAEDFLSRYDGQSPGCLVLDVRMPGISGLELQRRLRATRQVPPIIFITAHGEIPLATDAMRAGAIDFIQKPFSPHVLLERIREGLTLDQQSRKKRDRARDILERMNQLTEREREVMRLLAKGESTKAIARQLSITTKTVDNHRGKVLEKMNVDNPTKLAHLVSLIE